MKRILCSLGKKSIIKILTNIPDDVYRNLNVVERRVIAKACNSKDPQIYLFGAVEGMELAGFQFSKEFDSIYQDVVKNFDFDVYR
uniref:Uncharacterized protein n=1 Tax=Myoviridae sp. ctTRu92 TaxID=2825111 RepID=A0A8S5Q703_9CAUD|nr:MAG TPA: hypothetical protein [Myoviridae sp. ctTRu92]